MGLSPWTDALTDAWTDLVLGGECVGCDRPGRPLCMACRDALPERAVPVTPSRTGPLPVVTAAVYDGTVREMVVGWKERRLRALGEPLAGLLAGAVALALPPADGRPALLVPAPSRAAGVRARGLDTTAVLVARAARLLRAAGAEVAYAPLLRMRPGVADQAGLDVAERARNLAHAMVVRGGVLRRLDPSRAPRVVVCDDVLTSGATLREASRALAAAGLDVSRGAVVAATPRRSQPESVPGLS